MKLNTIMLGVLLSGSVISAAMAQQTGTMNAGTAANKIGNESMSEFDRQNKQGAAAVSAVSATDKKLSQADVQLMNEVAMGGMMQLEMSQFAVQKASNSQTKALAQAEVDEQTGLAAKLQEIASAKGVTLPTGPDAQAKTLLGKFDQVSGGAFDRLYITECGVKGHEKLDKVMSKVESSASDNDLKQLAKAAHPLVKTHLTVSRQVMKSM